MPLTPVEINRFNDGETYCRIKESVRGTHVFLIQPTSKPANDNLMELLLLIDALRRASVKEITAVVPYFGYARQDRKADVREPIAAKLAANLITKAGADRVVTFDLHVDQIQGFFDIPLDNLEALPLLAFEIAKLKLDDIVVVSPDAGGAKRARRLAKILRASLAIVDKRRPMHGVAEIANIMGEVKGKNAVLVDDIIDTGGSITKAAEILIEKGAKSTVICATHAVLSKDSTKKLGEKSIKNVIMTNTIAIPEDRKTEKMRIVSVDEVLSETIKRIFDGESMGIYYDGLYRKVTEILDH